MLFTVVEADKHFIDKYEVINKCKTCYFSWIKLR